jgi:hypothetical protein
VDSNVFIQNLEYLKKLPGYSTPGKGDDTKKKKYEPINAWLYSILYQVECSAYLHLINKRYIPFAYSIVFDAELSRIVLLVPWAVYTEVDAFKVKPNSKGQVGIYNV